MRGVYIGNGAVIGAGAVVAKDISPYAVAVGNPVKIIKYRFSKKIIVGLQQMKWWYWPKQNLSFVAQYEEDIKAFIEEYGEDTAVVEIKDSYYNMKEKILPVMHVVDSVVAAMEKIGVKPNIKAIRGGTDGARLSFMGLPTPNISRRSASGRTRRSRRSRTLICLCLLIYNDLTRL